MTADMIQVNSVSDMTLLCRVPRVTVERMSACSMGMNVVVRTDNQSVPKNYIWLSVTIFGCLGQPDNHYYEP